MLLLIIWKIKTYPANDNGQKEYKNAETNTDCNKFLKGYENLKALANCE